VCPVMFAACNAIHAAPEASTATAKTTAPRRRYHDPGTFFEPRAAPVLF
jgi:hypothetical protein